MSARRRGSEKNWNMPMYSGDAHALGLLLTQDDRVDDLHHSGHVKRTHGSRLDRLSQLLRFHHSRFGFSHVSLVPQSPLKLSYIQTRVSVNLDLLTPATSARSQRAGLHSFASSRLLSCSCLRNRGPYLTRFFSIRSFLSSASAHALIRRP